MPIHPFEAARMLHDIQIPDYSPLQQQGTLMKLQQMQGEGLLQQEDLQSAQLKNQQTQETIRRGQQVAQTVAKYGGDLSSPALAKELAMVDPAFSQVLEQHQQTMRTGKSSENENNALAQLHAAQTGDVGMAASERKREAQIKQDAIDAEADAGVPIGEAYGGPARPDGSIPRMQLFRVKGNNGLISHEERQTGIMGPKETPQRNIDPLSQAGIDAAIKLKTAESKLKPAAESNIPPLTALTRTTRAGRKYIDASQVEPKTLNELQIAAAGAGLPVVNKDTAGILEEIDVTKQNLDLMMETLKPHLAAGAAGRPFTAVGNTIQSALQTSDELSAVGTYRNAAIQAMRTVAGAKGLRINRAEIELAIQNDIPKITDTVGAAQQKLKNMNAFLENMEKAHLVKDRSASPTGPINNLKSKSIDDLLKMLNQ